jgi:RimJ/RimL family protein N-acetyltransferase
VSVNEFGQPVGDAVDWTPGPRLGPVTLTGRTCRLEPLSEQHVDGLYAALCVESPPSVWTYMNAGPFAERQALAEHLARLAQLPATVPLAVLLPNGTPVGVATWLRIEHAMGTAEVGHITYAASLQRTTAATEAMYLMAAHAFDVVGLRRYEWKCDSLNAPSRRAAERLGFAFEGVFRKAIHYKGRNRDTAWYAMVDDDWPRIEAAYDAWLAPTNFDDGGRQRAPLQCGSRPV